MNVQMDKCGSCNEFLVDIQDHIKCIGPCKKMHHLICTKLTNVENIQNFNVMKDKWMCDVCKELPTSEFPIRSLEVSSYPVTSRAFVTELNKFKNELRENFCKDLKKEVYTLKNEFVGMNKSMHVLSDTVNTMFHKMEVVLNMNNELVEEHQYLQNDIKTLTENIERFEVQLREIEQHYLKKNIEIGEGSSGSNENVMAIVAGLRRVLSMDIAAEDVGIAVQIPIHSNENSSKIVVDFHERQVEDAVLSKLEENGTLRANEFNEACSSNTDVTVVDFHERQVEDAVLSKLEENGTLRANEFNEACSSNTDVTVVDFHERQVEDAALWKLEENGTLRANEVNEACSSNTEMVVCEGHNDKYTIIYPENAEVKASNNMAGKAVLVCRLNSHPFQDRTLFLDEPVKIGRSVARARAAPNNGIFDCKVLSRNHALFWYSSGKFYLQDTKSSNGTFVNDQRLSMSGDESPPKEVRFGDVVQFGVDVLENARKVTHGCIVANLKLYLPDGREARPSPSTTIASSLGAVPIEDLYQLNQNIQEALQREQMLETKIASLQKMVASLRNAAEVGWKALINEDRLLCRVEVLENQLLVYSKNYPEDKLREELKKLQEDKEQYQGVEKSYLKKILDEKVEAVKKCHDVEMSLKNSETECNNLRELMRRSHDELKELAQKHSQQLLKSEELSSKLQENDDRHKAAMSQLELENEDIITRLEKNQANEAILQQKIEELEASGESAHKQLISLQRQLQNVNTISTSLSSPVLNMKNTSDTIREIIHDRNEKSEDDKENNEMIDVLLQRYSEVSEDKRQNKEVVALTTAQLELLQKEKLTKLQDINNLERTTEIYSDDVSHSKKELQTIEEIINSLPQKSEKLLELPIEVRNRITNSSKTSEPISKEDLNELLAEARDKMEDAERRLNITQTELGFAKESLAQVTENWFTQEGKLRETIKLQEEHEISLNSLKEQISSFQAKETQKKQTEKLDIDQETTNKDLEEIESLKKQLLEAQQAAKQSRNEVELVRDRLSLLEILQQQRDEGSDEVTLKLNSSQQELTNKKKEVSMLEECISCLENQVAVFKDQVEVLNSELTTAIENKNKVEEQLAKLTSDSTSDTEETLQEKSIIHDLEEKVTQLSEKVLYHKEQYLILLEEKTSITGELHKLRKEYESITQHPYFHTMFAIPLLILFFCTIIKFYPFLSTVWGTAEPTFVFSSTDGAATPQLPSSHDADLM